MFTFRIDTEYTAHVTNLWAYARRSGISFCIEETDRDNESVWYQVNLFEAQNEDRIEELLRNLPSVHEVNRA